MNGVELHEEYSTPSAFFLDQGRRKIWVGNVGRHKRFQRRDSKDTIEMMCVGGMILKWILKK